MYDCKKNYLGDMISRKKIVQRLPFLEQIDNMREEEGVIKRVWRFMGLEMVGEKDIMRITALMKEE